MPRACRTCPAPTDSINQAPDPIGGFGLGTQTSDVVKRHRMSTLLADSTTTKNTILPYNLIW